MTSRTDLRPPLSSPIARMIPMPVWLVAVMVLLSAMACMRQTDTLNQGRGTRDDPVTALQFARTLNYSIRGMSVMRPLELPRKSARDGYEFVGVEFEVLCTQGDEGICDLTKIAERIRLVSNAGYLYAPVSNPAVNNPLSGEILGNARKQGWIVYEVPVTVPISTATVGFTLDSTDLVFFSLP